MQEAQEEWSIEDVEELDLVSIKPYHPMDHIIKIIPEELNLSSENNSIVLKVSRGDLANEVPHIGCFRRSTVKS